MSWQATNWARTIKTGAPARKVILLLLADLADEAHSCYPGQERLAEDSEQSVKSVGRHLADLETRGLLRREARYVVRGGKKVRTSDRFFLPIDEPGGLWPAQEPAPADSPDVPDQGSSDLTDNLSGRSDGDLSDNLTGTYRTHVSEEPPVDPPVDGVESGTSAQSARGAVAAPRSDRPSSGLASLDRDEHGPLSPRCPTHRDQMVDVPCGACAVRREAYEVAQRRRADLRRRLEADEATQAARRERSLAAPVGVQAKKAAQIRASLQAQQAATATEQPPGASDSPVCAPEPAAHPS